MRELGLAESCGVGILLYSSEVSTENTGAGCCPLRCVSCPGMSQRYPYTELSLSREKAAAPIVQMNTKAERV